MGKSTWTVSTRESKATYKGNNLIPIHAKLLIIMEKETKRVLYLKSYRQRKPIKLMLKYCLGCDVERPALIEVDSPVAYDKIHSIPVISKSDGKVRSCPEEEFWYFLHTQEELAFPNNKISKTEDYKVFCTQLFDIWNEKQKQVMEVRNG